VRVVTNQSTQSTAQKKLDSATRHCKSASRSRTPLIYVSGHIAEGLSTSALKHTVSRPQHIENTSSTSCRFFCSNALLARVFFQAIDCLDLRHESCAALSGQPMHSRHCSLAAQPRVCQAVCLHNTLTSPNLTLDPLYWYMRPFVLARTVNVRSSFCDSTTAHYIDLLYAASFWVLGHILASPAEPCSTAWVVVQMTILKY